MPYNLTHILMPLVQRNCRYGCMHGMHMPVSRTQALLTYCTFVISTLKPTYALNVLPDPNHEYITNNAFAAMPRCQVHMMSSQSWR